ncbi:threonine ammonia-lyase [Peptoniphilus sp. MSJ-1]|uniref:L-threonine dehydratase catabolic TdcB n=1 Tax=Peptoniphilus ovalis TaxID=2841503 RepID=A0ABS6FIZ7_9FIRM|nr:threonine ammonia-lyase [Peptoniphilus ovalis]MBU5670038.1 threonine ammonia-lyase [Peptoniphilus ovalis]
MTKNLTIDSVYNAAFKLKTIVRKTDLIHAENLGENIYLKTENLQRTGSFKLRGAYNKISKLSKEEKERGVVATSAGNHAQGVALTCKKLGIPATIFMPEHAPLSKVEATRSYGAEVILEGNNYDEAFQASQEYNKKHNKTFIHAFDDIDVIAGQATLGLEILDQLVDVEAVIVPIGGGGLISGIAFLIKSLKPDTKIIGVEAENAASMKKSIEEGKIADLDTVNTFADGIAVKKPGELTFEFVKEYVDEIVTVSEDEIASAVLELLEKQKLMCEGSGAVSFAAIKHGKVDVDGKKTVALLSGGNIDVNILSRIISRGLVKSGRNTTLNIELSDKPGELVAVSKIIADHGANVVRVDYNTSEKPNEIFSCVLNIKCETRNAEHEREIKKAFKEQGFKLI